MRPSRPSAISASWIWPRSCVVALLGDGTFGFHCAELDTAVRHGLAYLAVVGNDACWNAEHQIQLRRRLESIKRIHKASDTLEDRMKELEHVREGIREQEKALEKQVEVMTRMLSYESAKQAGFLGIEQSA